MITNRPVRVLVKYETNMVAVNPAVVCPII